MTASSQRRLLATRLILGCFPKSWRLDGRAAEALGIAWEAADEDGREVLGLAEASDLAWLGLRARVNTVALILPTQTRSMIAILALLGGVGLATCLLLTALWAAATLPASSTPLASTGTALYVAWVATGIAIASGRELSARLAILGTATLAVAIAVFAHPLGMPRPALFLLTTMFVFNVLALGLRPVTSAARDMRWLVVGGAVLGGAATGVICRSIGSIWFPSESVFTGNIVALSHLASGALVVLALAALISIGSHLGRRQLLPAIFVSAGPWALLVARGSSAQGDVAHLHIAIVFASWLAVVMSVMAICWQQRAQPAQHHDDCARLASLPPLLNAD